MSIKARANVTISRIIDVEEEIRYYLKQPATLPEPTKPTSYPPPSAWKTTEPDYTNGSSDSSDASGDTDALYFVILEGWIPYTSRSLCFTQCALQILSELDGLQDVNK